MDVCTVRCVSHVAGQRCSVVCCANGNKFSGLKRLNLFQNAKQAVKEAQSRGNEVDTSTSGANRAKDTGKTWQQSYDDEFRRSSNPTSQDGLDIENYMRETLKNTDEDILPPTRAQQLQELWNVGQSRLKRVWEVVLYNYYNWRQDTVSDLLLILMGNTLLILTGSFVKMAFVDPFLAGEPDDPWNLMKPVDGNVSFLERFWPDVYRVTLLTFGENFPADEESVVFQVYSIAMALLGIIGFALLLALIEQILLEVLEANVQQGTMVFEQGHILVLSQCVAGKDMETLWRVLGQVCHAYAADGGRTVVVLSSKDKVMMEKVFRKAIPDRKGSRFIFRKGNPLLPNDLKEVSVVEASSVIIVSDNSREANEADAQSVRVSVHIDELVQKHEAMLKASAPHAFASYKRPHLVVEVLERRNCGALDFSTEIALSMVLTRNINAKRLARMITTPVIAGVSTMLFDFRTDSQQYSMNFPALKGQLFKNVPFMFDNATVLGIFPANSDQLIMNVSPGYVMQANDHVLLLRSSKLSASKIRINPTFERPSLGRWKPPILNDYTKVSPNAGGSVSDECDSPEDSLSAVDEFDTFSSHSKRVQTSTSPILISSSTASTSDSGSFGSVGGSSREESLKDSASQSKGISVRKEATVPNTRFYVLPQAYLQNADENAPIKLLVVGWGEQGFMQALLRELDSGDSSLPVSSTVVFLNAQPFATIQAAISECSVSCLHVSHCHGNPLAADTFDTLVDISEYSCAMCLCDNKWVDPDLDSTNGVDFLEQSDMLRLDSMLLLVQLHIRTALARKNLPDINIICEKLAIAGVTRFEDRFKLPLGISVNMTSFAAKVLIQSVYNPDHGLKLMAAVGNYANLTVIDSSVLVEVDEELSWLVLFAYYDIPASLDIPLKLHSNPLFDRCKKRVWNKGNSRRKVICWRTTHAHLKSPSSGADAKRTGTLDIRSQLAASKTLRMAEPSAPPPNVSAFDSLSLAVSDASEMRGIEVVDLNESRNVASLLAEDGLRFDPESCSDRGLPLEAFDSDGSDIDPDVQAPVPDVRDVDNSWSNEWHAEGRASAQAQAQAGMRAVAGDAPPAESLAATGENGREAGGPLSPMVTASSADALRQNADRNGGQAESASASQRSNGNGADVQLKRVGGSTEEAALSDINASEGMPAPGATSAWQVVCSADTGRERNGTAPSSSVSDAVSSDEDRQGGVGGDGQEPTVSPRQREPPGLQPFDDSFALQTSDEENTKSAQAADLDRVIHAMQDGIAVSNARSAAVLNRSRRKRRSDNS